ncbi:minor tail protein [Mycobacterium phage Cuke]|uniref:Minor tail protein n=1 Tax=Mycobacterium phage Cuke TaxID=2079417 RepID=A0A2L1IWS2_9CAUD|nr:minor tail protein [Mycobacterium phage Cuke]AVD99639.1 minor tail protein [Mycobacterium phage Cuke]
MVNKNLEPGQYQLGDFVFGFGTLFTVENFDPMGYDVNVQDYQSQLSSEIRFGSDSLKPLPIQIELNAFTNKLMGNIASLVGDTRELNFENDRQIGQFTREWRADEIRDKWGELKPLLICRKSDGRVVQAFGRPGKLAVSKPDHEGMRKVVGEFRRSDTLYYNDFEWFLQVRAGEVATVYRPYAMKMGDGDSWLRFILVGPMKNPIIQLGSITINLDHELEAGEVVEISSYPWARRAIRLNDGLSLNAKVTQPYLEKLNFPPNTPIQVSWNATDTNTQVEEVDFSDETNTSDGLNLTDWTATNYVGTDGHWEIFNGVIRWVDSGNGNRLATSIYKSPTITPYQKVGMTLATPAEGSLLGSEECSNRIIGRSNATGTEYLYWDITYTRCWFGHHKDGVDTILSEIYSLRDTMDIIAQMISAAFAPIFGYGVPQNDWVYDAEFGTGAGELTSTLKINDHQAVTFEGVSDLVLPSTNLYTGTGMRSTTRALGQSTPGSVSEWHMRDNSPVPQDISAVYMFWRDAWQNI